MLYMYVLHMVQFCLYVKKILKCVYMYSKQQPFKIPVLKIYRLHNMIVSVLNEIRIFNNMKFKIQVQKWI
jgi:hypothetical protein